MTAPPRCNCRGGLYGGSGGYSWGVHAYECATVTDLERNGRDVLVGCSCAVMFLALAGALATIIGAAVNWLLT